jgi:hypothetical protein
MFLSGVQSPSRLDSRYKRSGMTEHWISLRLKDKLEHSKTRENNL